MSWKDENAIKRIHNTFKRLGTKIFPEDKQALQQLNESLEFYKIKQTNDNKIYAKVLALLIKEYYSKNININTILECIDAELKSPLPYHIELLSNRIRTTELTNYIETLRIDIPENEFNDVDALTKRENEFWDIHKKSIFEEINKMWAVDEVSNKFYNSANEFLKDVNNYE